MAKKTAKNVKTHMAGAAAAEHIDGEEDIDAEIAALEASLDGVEDDADDIVLDDDVSEGDLEAAVAEVNLEEAKSEAYEEQEGGEDMSTEPVEKKAAKTKKPRKTMISSKKSEVATSKLGENAAGFILELSDAELDEKAQAKQRETFLSSIDDMAKKVGEKAVNLVAYAGADAKLSAYTAIALKFLVDKGSITTKDLIEHMQDQKANGVKGYSIGTARSQSHQMFQLFPAFKVGTLDGKTMTVNEESLIVAKFKS